MRTLMERFFYQDVFSKPNTGLFMKGGDVPGAETAYYQFLQNLLKQMGVAETTDVDCLRG